MNTDTVRATGAARARSVTAMSDRPRSERGARLFVALDLPEQVRDGIARWQSEALGDPALRRMGPEGLHVTLCFIGQRPVADVELAGEIVTALEPRPIELRLGPEPVPIPGGRPRMYALEARSEEADRLQSELSEALSDAGLHRPEKRPFWGHVTVARVRSERSPPGPGQRRGKPRSRRVSSPPRSLPDELTRPFGSVRVSLYRSKLKPQGAEYERLRAVDLPSPNRGQKK